VLGAGGYAGVKLWNRSPKVAPTAGSAKVGPPPPSSGTTAAAPVSAAPSAKPPPPPWLAGVQKAQEAMSGGDLKGALRLLKEAYDKGGSGVPKTLLEHVQIGINAAAAKASCALTGLARPRTYDFAPPPSGRPAFFHSGRPSIAVGPRGAVMTWTDAHTGSEHAYAALLDEAMRVVDEPVDVTPEAGSASRPELLAAGDKVLLVFWDSRGEGGGGARARFLDATGKPEGTAVVVGKSTVRGGWAAVSRAPDGSFYVAFPNESEIGSEDLFLSRLSPKLEPQGEPIRMTDFIPVGASKPRARYPSVAVHGDALHIAFRLEREPSRTVHHIRVPLAEASGKGLEAAGPNARTDRSIGEMVLVNTDKTKAEGPSMACGGDACFIAWHAEMQGGMFGAIVEPSKAQPAWRKKFSRGARPALAFAPGGQAQLVWFESGRVVTGSLGRDGLGGATKIARVISDQPTPSITAGKKPGEWYVAWLDYEAGHLEPYAARFECR
jgi:serine/threonine-protein kinase